ncbi:hypothetical protein SynA1560_01632 [Synechococcus sp. A15-60]|nr:hypothetical protein SynA1560_01632 [Synechococcus sp. A15-60]
MSSCVDEAAVPRGIGVLSVAPDPIASDPINVWHLKMEIA